MIKFRAYLKGTGIIVDVQDINYKYKEIVYENEKYMEVADFKDVILLQSTGLKDAHGTEIYEKDIVRDSYGDVFLIEWLDGSFVLTDFFSGGYDHCSIDDSEAYEIVGNQFEHPHLLKVITNETIHSLASSCNCTVNKYVANVADYVKEW